MRWNNEVDIQFGMLMGFGITTVTTTKRTTITSRPTQ